MIELDTKNISGYIDSGKCHKDWYDYEADSLIKLLPEFKGFPIIRAFAITSMTTSIEANVCLALKALQQMKRGEDFNRFLPNQITYLNLMKQGKDVPGRKIMSFIRALEGDENSVVVDIWMCRAFGLNKKRNLNGRVYHVVPTKKEYDAIENFVKKDSKKHGLSPRQYQAVVWGAIKSQESVVSKNVSWSDILYNKKGLFSY